MKLYYSPGACSMTPHIILREAHYEFELVRVDIPSKKTADGRDYWQINRMGYVPTLETDDGHFLTEAGVIAQYLADQKPDSGLAPMLGTMERYRLMAWLNFIATEVHKQIGALFNPKLTGECREIQLGVITRRLNALEKMREGKPYVMGDHFTIADAYLFNIINWSKLHKIDLGPWPNIKAHYERIAARPRVQETMKAEGLIK